MPRYSRHPAAGAQAGHTVWLALRPEKLRITRESPASDTNKVSGAVWDIGYLGDFSVYQVRLDSGLMMKATVPNTGRASDRSLAPQDRVWLTWDAQAGVVLTK